MMQTAEPWGRKNVRVCRDFQCSLAPTGSLLLRAEVSSIIVVVADVLIHEALQMSLVENDHVVEKISTTVADEALRDAILPWALKAGSFGFDVEAHAGLNDLYIEIGSSIENQITRRRIVRKRLTQLLNYPGAHGTRRHVAMKDPPPVVRDDSAKNSARF
jgi:hypothetical protein